MLYQTCTGSIQKLNLQLKKIKTEKSGEDRVRAATVPHRVWGATEDWKGEELPAMLEGELIQKEDLFSFFSKKKSTPRRAARSWWWWPAGASGDLHKAPIQSSRKEEDDWDWLACSHTDPIYIEVVSVYNSLIWSMMDFGEQNWL